MITRRYLVLSALTLILLLIGLAAGAVLARGPSLPVPAPSTQIEADTAFTYQGHLSAVGGPANGSFDFQFRLFDDAIAGNPIGLPVTKASVDVSDGLFSLDLNFGSDAFNGEARWLEIGVRETGASNTFTTLDPRQSIRPAPYAIHALVDDDTLGNLYCEHNQVAKWNDIAQEWQCAAVSDEVDAHLEFTSDGTFNIPEGVRRIQVEVWGAGGGGGNHGDGSLSGGGGGGGSGGYSLSRIDVTPGEPLTISIGQGGDPGLDGGPTSVQRGTVELVLAAGGKAGQDGQDGDCGTNTPGPGGTGGAGGLGDTENGTLGMDGGSGFKGGFPITRCNLGVTGAGGAAIEGSVAPGGSIGGNGGGAVILPDIQVPPVPGGNGYVFIRW